MSHNLIISISVGLALLVILNEFLDLRLLSDFKELILRALAKFVNSVGNYNINRYVERYKKERIEKRKSGLISKYNGMIEMFINEFKLPLTLEAFNSIICIIFSILVIGFIVVFQSFSLSILVSISIIVGLITYLTMKSRIQRSSKIEDIMDAEDLICPLARDGVQVAIKKVLESDDYIKKSIRHYFVQFIDNIENHGYSFKRAMEILNRQLGPKFDNFAKKTIIFEYNERKGMADIFLDIVDENAILREINSRKNRIFKKMNRDFIIKTGIIVLFVLYTLTSKEIQEFFTSSDLGRYINGFSIVTICLSFARCQSLQNDIGTVRRED